MSDRVCCIFWTRHEAVKPKCDNIQQVGYEKSTSLLRMTINTDQVKFQLNLPWLNLSMTQLFFKLVTGKSTLSELSKFPEALVDVNTDRLK